MVGLVTPSCVPDHVGDGGGGRRLAKDIGFRGLGLSDLLIVFLTGRVGGRGSKCFGIASSHLEVRIELDLTTLDDPVCNKVFSFGADGLSGSCVTPFFESLSRLVSTVTFIFRVVEFVVSDSSIVQ